VVQIKLEFVLAFTHEKVLEMAELELQRILLVLLVYQLFFKAVKQQVLYESLRVLRQSLRLRMQNGFVFSYPAHVVLIDFVVGEYACIPVDFSVTKSTSTQQRLL
jgi:hypothetical protein